jgi:hypothetical protein
MKRKLVVVMVAAVWAVAAGVTGALAANGAAPNGTNFCPFTFMNTASGPDPDFVTLAGPSAIPASGTTPVGVTASESEAAANTVTLQLMVKLSMGGSPMSASSTGKHNTTTTVKLAGQPGVTYTINWFATFDNGIHPCSSALPGYQPFTITSG